MRPSRLFAQQIRLCGHALAPRQAVSWHQPVFHWTDRSAWDAAIQTDPAHQAQTGGAGAATGRTWTTSIMPSSRFTTTGRSSASLDNCPGSFPGMELQSRNNGAGIAIGVDIGLLPDSDPNTDPDQNGKSAVPTLHALECATLIMGGRSEIGQNAMRIGPGRAPYQRDEDCGGKTRNCRGCNHHGLE